MRYDERMDRVMRLFYSAADSVIIQFGESAALEQVEPSNTYVMKFFEFDHELIGLGNTQEDIAEYCGVLMAAIKVVILERRLSREFRRYRSVLLPLFLGGDDA